MNETCWPPACGNGTASNLTEEPFIGFGPELGFIFIAHSSLYFFPYIPTLMVIFEKPQILNSCFKIMAALGVNDMIGLCFGGFASGIFSVLGMGYENYYRLMKVLSSPIMFGWTSYCALALVLGLNRCMELHSKAMAEKWFGGNKTYYWIAACHMYGLVYGVSFAFPRIEILYMPAFGVWAYMDVGPIFGLVNNTIVSCIMTIEYVALIIIFREKSKQVSEQAQAAMGSKERQLMLQSLLICSILMVCAILYMIIPYLPVNKYVYAGANVAWQICQGGNVYIYLFLNATIRRKVLRKFGIKSAMIGATTAPVQSMMPSGVGSTNINVKPAE